MKKTVFVLIALIVTYSFSQAQRTRYFFTGGIVIANYEGNFDYSPIDGLNGNGKPKTGITAGIMASIPISRNFNFQTAINFVQKGTKQTVLFPVQAYSSTRVNCIEVPLNIFFRGPGNKDNFFIGAGPSLAVALWGKLKSKADANTDSYVLKFGNGEDDYMNAFDPGASFLMGGCFSNGLLLTVNYNRGFNNLLPDLSGNDKWKSSYFGIKLGYFLRKIEKQ